MDFKVIDKDGVWLVNQGEHPLPDYGRAGEIQGSDLVILAPGVPTKIKHSEFLKAQPTVVETDNPLEDAPKAKK